MDQDTARTALLDSAERLFYARGIQAVGMDEIRNASGVPLKRLYQCFPSKGDLVEAYLRRRDERWRGSLADHVARHGTTPESRVPALFDWLHGWFAEPDFRGCAFINSFGELGAGSDAVAAAVRDHKAALRAYLSGLVANLSVPAPDLLADQLLLLIDGATTTAAITGDPTCAHAAARAAQVLVASAPAPA